MHQRPSRLLAPIVALFALALAAPAAIATTTASDAGLTPARRYFAVNARIEMRVDAPPGAGALEIRLLEPGTAAVRASAPVHAGPVDLAGLFPTLWKPEGPPEFYYAQLFVDGTAMGPAVALAPMIDPELCLGMRERRDLVFRASRQIYSGLQAWVDQTIVFDTSLGEIEFALRPDAGATTTVRHVMELVDGGFYDGLIFHRVVPRLDETGEPFLVQTGDPTGTGFGGPGRYLLLERSRLPHDFGVLSMAREPDGANTNGSQLMICLSRRGTEFLDGYYTSLAQAIRGADTIIAISQVQLGTGDQKHRPIDPPVIRRAYLKPAAPYGTGPRPVTRPAASPAR